MARWLLLLVFSVCAVGTMTGCEVDVDHDHDRDRNRLEIDVDD